jgi:hypothetical protein
VRRVSTAHDVAPGPVQPDSEGRPAPVVQRAGQVLGVALLRLGGPLHLDQAAQRGAEPRGLVGRERAARTAEQLDSCPDVRPDVVTQRPVQAHPDALRGAYVGQQVVHAAYEVPRLGLAAAQGVPELAQQVLLEQRPLPVGEQLPLTGHLGGQPHGDHTERLLGAGPVAGQDGQILTDVDHARLVVGCRSGGEVADVAVDGVRVSDRVDGQLCPGAEQLQPRTRQRVIAQRRDPDALRLRQVPGQSGGQQTGHARQGGDPRDRRGHERHRLVEPALGLRDAGPLLPPTLGQAQHLLRRLVAVALGGSGSALRLVELGLHPTDIGAERVQQRLRLLCRLAGRLCRTARLVLRPLGLLGVALSALGVLFEPPGSGEEAHRFRGEGRQQDLDAPEGIRAGLQPGPIRRQVVLTAEPVQDRDDPGQVGTGGGELLGARGGSGAGAVPGGLALGDADPGRAQLGRGGKPVQPAAQRLDPLGRLGLRRRGRFALHHAGEVLGLDLLEPASSLPLAGGAADVLGHRLARPAGQRAQPPGPVPPDGGWAVAGGDAVEQRDGSQHALDDVDADRAVARHIRSVARRAGSDRRAAPRTAPCRRRPARIRRRAPGRPAARRPAAQPPPGQPGHVRRRPRSRRARRQAATAAAPSPDPGPAAATQAPVEPGHAQPGAHCGAAPAAQAAPRPLPDAQPRSPARRAAR